MAARFLADAVVVLHLGFVAFVVLGALLVVRWPRVAWVQLPCAVYGAAIELGGWTCPLTYLENALRRRAGAAGYTGGFLEHYALPLLYPGPLPSWVWFALAATVVLANAGIYGFLVKRPREAHRAIRQQSGC